MRLARTLTAACLSASAILFFLLPQTVRAQWTDDPYRGMVTVTDLPGEDGGPQIVRLGSGNYLIVWWHRIPNTDDGQLWYQLLDPLGNIQLAPTGNLVLPGATWSYGGVSSLVLDGAGGAIVVFADLREGSSQICGQRFDQIGNALWGPTGLALVEWPGNTALADVTSDNAGFFVAWNASEDNLYAQKFNVEGQRLWGDNGVSVSTAPGSQIGPQIVPNASGGALVLWEDNRGGGYTFYLYVQELDENGGPILTLNGIPLYSPGTSTQLSVGGLVEGESDGEDGGVFAYTTPGWTNWQHVLRVNSQGLTQWVWGNGIYAAGGIIGILKHPVDSTIWVSATDSRTGSDQLYLYHLNLNGHPLFNPAGILGGEAMAPTSNGIITFETLANARWSRIVSKCFNSAGRQIWESIVALARTVPGSGPALTAIMSSQDGSDGAVITMLDDRMELNEFLNIIAQRVQRNGQLGNPVLPPQITSKKQPQLSLLSGNLVQFTLPQAGQVKLELYDILGRMITTLQEGYQPAGMHSVKIDEPALPSGVYLLRLRTGQYVGVQKMALLK